MKLGKIIGFLLKGELSALITAIVATVVSVFLLPVAINMMGNFNTLLNLTAGWLAIILGFGIYILAVANSLLLILKSLKKGSSRWWLAAGLFLTATNAAIAIINFV